jgi:hypothetical protein
MRLTSSSDGRGKPLSTAIAEWAAGTPDIQRVWMVWVANGGRWRRELQARIDQAVNLDWFDPDGATRQAAEAKTLIYARA